MKKYIRLSYYWAAALLAGVVRMMPYPLAVGCGGFLGLLAHSLVRDAREVTERNLRAAFPDATDVWVRRTARGVFRNQGRNLFELFSFPRLDGGDVARLVAIENREAFDRALAGGRGVLIASAHCGNWELMGAALAQAGYPINVIARRIYIEGLNRMLVSYRNMKGMNVILRSGRDSAREMLRGLRHNEAIAMLIDQDTDVPGVFVEYFGRKAWTPSGLATLALKTGAAVITCFDVRGPDNTHRVMVDGPFEMTRTGDLAADVEANTARITEMIEKHVRKHPDQWVWMHRRWKTAERPQA